MVFGPGLHARPLSHAAAGWLVEVLAATLFLNLMLGPEALQANPHTLLLSGFALVLYRLAGLLLDAVAGPHPHLGPWVLPPLSLFALASLAEPRQLPPIVAAVWGAALLGAIIHPENGRQRSRATRGLPPKLAWICASTSAAALLLISGAAISANEGSMPTPLHIALGLIGVPITVGLAALTGGLVGLVLSRDILGLSRALDRNLDQPNFPLKVTRNDRLGIVQATLEEQRCHLLDTLAQHAEASAQLREANTAKVELVSALNHNLRTSLTTILGHLQLLDTDTDPWIAQHRHELDTLNSLAEGLLHQLRSFVEIAMLASEELRLHLVETDVEELLDRALLDHLDSAATAGLKLVRNRQAEPLPTICADSRRLGQALHILLDHAIELAEPSTISISTGIQELQGVLEISIVFSQREHGAEADLSLPNTRMVLGLELAQAIASGHGGDLLARTNPAGLSTLILTLPLSPERCPSPDLNLPTTGAQERGLSTSPERAA